MEEQGGVRGGQGREGDGPGPQIFGLEPPLDLTTNDALGCRQWQHHQQQTVIDALCQQPTTSNVQTSEKQRNT